MTPEQKTDVLEILTGARDVNLATVREDGYPQVTTVSFVHQGITIYFGCAASSQKASNIRRIDKVSLSVNLPYQRWDEIRGLSLAGRARIVTDSSERERVGQSMMTKFPQIRDYAFGDQPQQLAVVRIDPEVISLLDYRKGFGHTEEFSV